mmetsp:Transcript_18652/g.37806  ORF Transcript_18652/g.37806 Transcript_18652/m.37806 type:complete len:86 (-) Transcript_18652:354-611(-)
MEKDNVMDMVLKTIKALAAGPGESKKALMRCCCWRMWKIFGNSLQMQHFSFGMWCFSQRRSCELILDRFAPNGCAQCLLQVFTVW